MVWNREAHRVLTQNKREELADALFNQAYSCLMAMAMWGGDGGVERTHTALRQDPLLANSMWCACRFLGPMSWIPYRPVPLLAFFHRFLFLPLLL